MSTRAWIMLFALALSWGMTFFLVEILLDEMTPFQIIFHRVGLAAIAMLIFIRLRGKKLPCDAKSWFALAVMGFFNNALPFSAIAYAQVYITGGLASILNTTTALFGVIVSGLLLKDERTTLAKFVGVGIGITGVVIIMGFEHLAQLSLANIGQMLMILAAISYALSGVWGKLKLGGTDPEITATGMLIGSTVIMFVITTATEGLPFVALSGGAIAAIITSAVLCTGVAYILYFSILAEAGASNVMLVTIMIPPIALTLDAVGLGEWVSIQELIGFIVISAGLLVISGKIKLN